MRIIAPPSPLFFIMMLTGLDIVKAVVITFIVTTDH